MAATDYEKLGVFYLGKEYDLAAGARRPGLVLYDSKDLVTHAVCVGMTGSGKTGLGIGLIEEAALDGVPVLAIDPKGDLANLLLTFPDLAPGDFAPWVDPSDASRHSLTPEAFAAQQAELWNSGPRRMGPGRRPHRAAARRGRLPPLHPRQPRRRAAGAARLAQRAARREPRRRAHADHDHRVEPARAGRPDRRRAAQPRTGAHRRHPAAAAPTRGGRVVSARPTCPGSSARFRSRPFDKIGVLDLETFYPAKDRQELALRFNSVLATPGFDVWLDGDPLDVGAMLYTPAGKPRVAIVSIAHLGDTERMLVVSLLLSALLDWTRKQGGTSSLRAMLYMDEVFGYLPPVANPPSKAPLLTLLKQARAFGVGVVLATQNPGRSRLQGAVEHRHLVPGQAPDRARQGARARRARRRDLGARPQGSRRDALGPEEPRLPHAQRARDRARGVRNAMDPVVPARPDGPRGAEESVGHRRQCRQAVGRDDQRRQCRARPSYVGPGLQTRAIPPAPSQSSRPTSPSTSSAPPPPPCGAACSTAAARIHYTDAKLGIDTVQDLHVTVPFTDGAVPVDWENAEPATERPEDLVPERPRPGPFLPLPPAALDARKYTAWTRDFGQWVMRAERLALFSAPSVKLISRAGESERDFRLRLHQAARESRDAAVEKLRASYAPKAARLTQRVATAEQGVAPRGGSGVAAEDADDGVVRRHCAWRAARPKSGQRLHARPRHHRGPRRRPIGQGDRRTSGAPGRSWPPPRRS